MTNTFSLEQTSKTGNLGNKILLRQYKLDLMAKFIQIKSVNPKIKQSELANN